MYHSLRPLLIISLLGLCLAGGIASSQASTTFTVNSTADDIDAVSGDGICETMPGNGICTLRAAIRETNARSGPDTIILPSGTYRLSRLGKFEDAAATGDLDITDDITIIGAGATRTIIDGNNTDRVFDIFGTPNEARVIIDGVRIQHGNPLFVNQEDNHAIATSAHWITADSGAR